MYHLELRQFPHVSRIFNLSREQLEAQFVTPWVGGRVIEADDRRWAPDRVRLTILEGPSLRPHELGLGRGWATAAKNSADVTEAVLAQARRRAGARPEVEGLKAAIQEVAAQPLGLPDVMALAAAAHPSWRVSEQLAVAEQAVWEMLHQGRLTMSADGEPLDAAGWEAVILSWAMWTADGAAGGQVQLRAPT